MQYLFFLLKESSIDSLYSRDSVVWTRSLKSKGSKEPNFKEKCYNGKDASIDALLWGPPAPKLTTNAGFTSQPIQNCGCLNPLLPSRVCVIENLMGVRVGEFPYHAEFWVQRVRKVPSSGQSPLKFSMISFIHMDSCVVDIQYRKARVI